MSKIALVLIVVVIIALMGFAAILLGQNPWLNPVQENQPAPNPAVLDHKNITYIIENRPIKLINGYSEIEAAPGSASKIITKYFGNEAVGDLNGDGLLDVAFLLTQETGGTGVFYYLAAALALSETEGIKTGRGYIPTNTILLGDRIAPQPSRINNGELVVNYAERKLSEPMTAAPSIGVSRYFKIEGGKLVEQVDQANFGDTIDLVVNQKVKLEDGLIVTLKEINDSRCQPGAVCVWAGELSPLLHISGGSLGNFTGEVRLGTLTAKKVVKNDYTFELKKATETTVTIMVAKEPSAAAACRIGGCSGQICSDEDVITTCEYKEEYACYKTAKCERQANGQCGWTQTPTLQACLVK